MYPKSEYEVRLKQVGQRTTKSVIVDRRQLKEEHENECEQDFIREEPGRARTLFP